MFEGDNELNFTPEEAALVARAEGRTPRQRRAPAAHPHHGGGGGILLGLLLAGILMVGRFESLKVSNANSAAVAASEPLRPARSSSIKASARSQAPREPRGERPHYCCARHPSARL